MIFIVATTSKKYYQRIYLDENKTLYWINQKGGKYLGTTSHLEDALYYRDLYSNNTSREIPKPSDVDLKTNNPYREHGLKYPVPERLKKKEKKPRKNQSKGKIYKRSTSCYALYNGKDYLCSCRTSEHAQYTLEKLRENNWDTTQLPRIQEKYPEYYTKLLIFYQYIGYDKKLKKWFLSIPAKHNDGKLEHIRFTNIEDALYERDMLKKCNWDYELLVETINDNNNPYYDMTLPPYPERKIRHISERKTHKKELTLLAQMIRKEPDLRISYAAKQSNMHEATIRVWLKQYNLTWAEFKTIVLTEEDPFTKMKLKPLIYTPDLSPSAPSNFTGYVQKSSRSEKNPYIIEYKHCQYGSYPTRELAEKIAIDLKACGWDKEQLKSIQEKHDFQPVKGSRNLIYPGKREGSWFIRKTINYKRVMFGTYHDYNLACIIRNLLQHNNWNKEELPFIQDKAKILHRIIEDYKYSMHTLNGGFVE